jgi:protein gp37
MRLQSMGNGRYRNGFRLTLHDDVVDLPRSWRSGRMIFVNSMSDLFHDNVPLSFIQRVFETMRECPQHVFQVLTKRSGRLRRIAAEIDWPENVWMGVSVENAAVLSRVDDLRAVPAAIRFLSCEPLIGSLEGIDLQDIHWVIVGGESGPGARPMQIEWVREIFRACRGEKVPFFFKQWGGVRKDLTGRLLRGKTYDEMPDRVAA